jgi:hypothetical protein
MRVVCVASRVVEQVVFGATDVDRWRWATDVDIAISLARHDGEEWITKAESVVAEAESIVNGRLPQIETLAKELAQRHELSWAEAREAAGYAVR